MSEHIRYNTNTSMATYLIGSTAIRYEYLDQILPPIVDKIQENEKIIFHVDLEGIIYGLYRKSNLPQLHAMEFDILVKDITVGVINVLAHYRQYFATRLGMDNEILVYWNYELPAYQKSYCHEYRDKMYGKYNPQDPNFGTIYQATRKAVKMVANLLQFVEGIYWIDNGKYDTYSAITYAMTTKKYYKYYHLIFSRTMMLGQLVGKRVAMLVHKRQLETTERGGKSFTSGASYLITKKNVYEKVFYNSKEKAPEIDLPINYIPIVWTLSKYSDMGIERLIYTKVTDCIRHLEELYHAGAIGEESTIPNIIDELAKARPKYVSEDAADRIKKEASDRYKILNLKLAAKGINKPQVMSMYRGMIDLYDQNALEKLNEQLTAEDPRADIINLSALNMSYGKKNYRPKKRVDNEAEEAVRYRIEDL